MNDRSDLGMAVGHQLEATACAFDVPPGDVDAVLRRGGQRLRRRRRATAGLTALALVAGSAGTVSLLGAPSEVEVGTGPAVARGKVGIGWRTVRPDSGLGPATGVGSVAPLYAVSTAPGQADPNQVTGRVVWRSDDGIEWTPSMSPQDLYVADLATRGDRVYSVGTGPATAAARGEAPPLVVGWSDDDAKTWERRDLPIDLRALDSRTTELQVSSATVATGSRGTVVSAVLSGRVDVRTVLPAGATAPHGWAVTATGVDLLGPDRGTQCPAGTVAPETPAERTGRSPSGEPPKAPPEKAGTPESGKPPGEVHPTYCRGRDDAPVIVRPQDAQGVLASYTWEQLRVDGDLLRAVRRQPVAFAARPGSDRFERVELPDIPSVQGPLLLEAGDDGFDLVVTAGDDGKPRDGTWAPNLVVLHSDDGRAWRSSTMTPGGLAVSASAMGRIDGRLTIVGQSEQGAVLLRSDGAGQWTTTSLAGLAGAPPTSEMLMVSAAMGPFGIVAATVVVPREGSTQADYEANQRILVSRDGTTWEEHSVTELAGGPVRSVLRAGVVGERATVTVSLKVKDGDPPQQVVLVGTPS